MTEFQILPIAEKPQKSIVWLASYPKSGNTWMRLFLEALLGGTKEPIDLSQKFSYTRFTDMSPELFLNLSNKQLGLMETEEVLQLRRNSHIRLSNMAKPFVFAKTHAPNGTVQGQQMFFPETTAKAIYIVRNPLDVVSSYADHMGLTVDESIDQLANPGATMTNWSREMEGEHRFINDPISSWSLNVASWLKKPLVPTYLVRYEDLLNDPVLQFGHIVQFLGAPFSTEQIKTAIELTSFKQLKRSEQKTGFWEVSKTSKSGTFFREGKSNNWKEKLSRKQAKRLIASHKDLMKELKYQTSV